jgi:hypothetical protein
MKRLILCGLVLTFLLLNSCSTVRSSSSESDVVSLKYEIILGTGYGFAGENNGYAIDTLGNIFSWKGKMFNTSLKLPEGKLTSEQITKINALITSAEILNTGYRRHGSITSFITLKGLQREKNISWINETPISLVPQNIIMFDQTVRRFIEDSGSQNLTAR